MNRTYILEGRLLHHGGVRRAFGGQQHSREERVHALVRRGGDSSLAEIYTQSSTETYAEGDSEEVTNQFDNAVLDGAEYLSRNDWSVLDEESGVPDVLASGALTAADGSMSGQSDVTDSDGTVGTLEMSDELAEAYALSGYEASGNPLDPDTDYTAVRTYGEDNGLELVDMMDLDYDSEAWELLLNEMKFSEIYELYGHAGYGTIAISSINKPKTMEYDGPTGINSYVGDYSGYGFPNEISMAATWNKELLEIEGILIGHDALYMSSGSNVISGWYAPAVNIHRTAFSGRNYEYYSEDPVLSGILVSNVIQGVQSKGVYVYLKHYALNDQETNRSVYGNVSTYSTEQAIREIYLKPFEYGVKDGGAKGIMTSMNRVGYTYAAGNYSLNTAVLRNEWGFEGCVITDYTGGPTAAYADQILASGGDLIMCSGWSSTTGVLSDYQAEWVRAELRRAAHNVLYVQANSLSMNGFVHGAVYSEGFAVYKIILIAVWVAAVAGMGVGGFFIYRKLAWTQEQWYARKRISAKGWIIIGCCAAVVVAALLIVFFAWLWPILSTAFVL